MASSTRRILAKKKIVPCTHCSEWIEVSHKAMSVFCPKCRQRVVLEDYRIKSYHAVRKLYTCGNIVVDKNGTLSASAKAANMTVRGKVWGTAEIREKMQITKSGYVRGDVRASRLVVQEGATLDGYYEVGMMKVNPPPTDRGARPDSQSA